MRNMVQVHQMPLEEQILQFLNEHPLVINMRHAWPMVMNAQEFRAGLKLALLEKGIVTSQSTDHGVNILHVTGLDRSSTKNKYIITMHFQHNGKRGKAWLREIHADAEELAAAIAMELAEELIKAASEYLFPERQSTLASSSPKTHETVLASDTIRHF
jgi:hypothetical protein